MKLIKFLPELNLQAVGKLNLVISLKSYQPSNLVPCYIPWIKEKTIILTNRETDYIVSKLLLHNNYNGTLPQETFCGNNKGIHSNYITRFQNITSHLQHQYHMITNTIIRYTISLVYFQNT